MRLALSGPLTTKEPIVVLYIANGNFLPLDFIELGYTNYEAICIGGAGGSGGGINTNNTGTFVRSYGAAGGGGGLHRVLGVLSSLPFTVPVIVGQGGGLGITHASNPILTTNGGNGGASTFNSALCRASGGFGGGRVQANSQTASSFADGGQGGVGNQTEAGGGASGGTSGVPTTTGPGILGSNGADGTWNGIVGSGGGGGAGGVGKYPSGISCNPATLGGRGAYDASDQSVFAPNGLPTLDLDAGALNTVPGFAGGAKLFSVPGASTIYGSSSGFGAGNPGVVAIRITAV